MYCKFHENYKRTENISWIMKFASREKKREIIITAFLPWFPYVCIVSLDYTRANKRLPVKYGTCQFVFLSLK